MATRIPSVKSKARIGRSHVARVERSETRERSNAETPLPDFAPLNPGYFSARPGRARREFERHAVHAVAQAGRLRPVVEDVAEMAAAAMARHRRARHAERAVGGLVDGLVERRPEARPAGAAFEFGLRREQRQVAAGAGERAVAMLLEQLAGERPLGAFL